MDHSHLYTTPETESLAEDKAEVRQRHESNRAGWNEGAARYSEGLEKTIAFLRGGGSSLHRLEKANLGDLKAWCKTAVHLQCASGEDTLSLWNEGVAEVVGVDISDVHIANAQKTSDALNAPARWYRCDILDTPAELNETADLVYTGQGALCWLHDLDGWARVVYRLLKPDGIVHILDDHPTSWLFDQEKSVVMAAGISYFGYTESNQGWGPTYIGELDKPREELAVKYERLWTLAEIFQALTKAGLTVTHLGEHADEYWEAFPYLPPEEKAKLPMTFTMMATK
ncbi:MAG: methyltransferase domain-containing protein [Chloroflexota bacterium]